MQDPQWLHVFIDIRADVADASAKFWSAALGCRIGDPWPNHPEFAFCATAKSPEGPVTEALKTHHG
jgi:hypothetical protein